MTDLNSLKARIEQASQILRKTSAVRPQESLALINMWRQMRARFARQNIPFKTRRSSTRGTPRGLFGYKGWITDHSKSVKSKRAMSNSFPGV